MTKSRHIFDVFSAWVSRISVSSFSLAQLARWSSFEYPHDTFPRNFFFNPIKGFSDFRGSDWKPKSQKIIFLTMFPCYWYIEPKNFHRIQILGAFFFVFHHALLVGVAGEIGNKATSARLDQPVELSLAIFFGFFFNTIKFVYTLSVYFENLNNFKLKYNPP